MTVPTITLDILLDAMLFDDYVTANAKLAPLNLKAVPLDDTGSFKIVSTLDDSVLCVYGTVADGAQFIKTGSEDTAPVISEDYIPRFESFEIAEAMIAEAMADTAGEGDDEIDVTDDSTKPAPHGWLRAIRAEPTPDTPNKRATHSYTDPKRGYVSPFLGTVKEGDTDIKAMHLMEEFRRMVTPPYDYSRDFINLLGYYARDNSMVPGPREPYPEQQVTLPLQNKTVPISAMHQQLDPETLARYETDRRKAEWMNEVKQSLTTDGFAEWESEKYPAKDEDDLAQVFHRKQTADSQTADDKMADDYLADLAARLHVESREPSPFVSSTSDHRTVNNVMRHGYRVLSPEEKDKMAAIKDMGLEFWELIDRLGNSRELSIAKTKVEEATMWAIKDLTK